MDFKNKNYLIIALITAFLAFILLLCGVRFILDNEIGLRTFMAYVVFSLVIGILTGILVLLKLNIAFISFVIGLMIGFFEMYRAFINGMAGWGDLIGILALMTWAAVGLGAGMLGQLGYYLYSRHIRSRHLR